LTSLALKLALTPLLIGAASLAGRRWGPALSGWLVGLPFTSAPIAFFLALEHGTSFAAASAVGTLAGAISQAGFCVVYAGLAFRWSWRAALVSASVAFAIATVVLRDVQMSAPMLMAIVAITLVVAIRLLPATPPSRGTSRPLPSWDLPARMILATAIVLLLTGVAPALGPHLTGLLSPFPVYAAILTVFAHRREGAAAATAVLRGLLLGLFAFALFFLALAILLEPGGLLVAFVVATATALATQGVTLWVLRRIFAA
jgi:hypothetical protein